MSHPEIGLFFFKKAVKKKLNTNQQEFLLSNQFS